MCLITDCVNKILMESYKEIVQKIINEGKRKENRTGIDTIAIAGATFEHDMSEGFPLLTTKKMARKTMAVELEGFINGIADKQWYKERGCNIWNDWCNPEKVPYLHDEETKDKMRNERDLGPIYGFQWRHFGADYQNFASDYEGKGIDQLRNLTEKLKENPEDRRMIVSAWNPQDLGKMALPPCHYSFQTTVIDDKLNLFWNQRSVDTALGLPFNIASYGLLLHLLAKDSGLEEGKLVGFLGDTHIYENHLKELKEQLQREPYPLTRVKTAGLNSIFDWNHDKTSFENYNHHSEIKFPVAV